MENTNIKLSKKVALVLATSCLLCTINTVHSTDGNNENINNIINENNNIADDILQNISLNDNQNANTNNNQNLITNNKNELLSKKRKRAPYTKHNITITYRDLDDANNTLKKLISEQKSYLQDRYNGCPDKTSPLATSCMTKIGKLTVIDNKQFPILNLKKFDKLLFPTIDDYYHLNYILEQVKILKQKIRNKISYKKNNVKQLTLILNTIQNDNKMNKALFKKLKEIGVIQNSKIRIHRWESAKTLETVGKQRQILDQLCNIYDNIKEAKNKISDIKNKENEDNKNKNNKIENTENMTHWNNVIKNNITKFYEIIMNTADINLIFERHSGLANYITRSIEHTVENIYPILLDINKEYVFGIDRQVTSFNTVRNQFVNGMYHEYDFSKTSDYNVNIVKEYYRKLLRNSDVFMHGYSDARSQCKVIINELKQYNNAMSNNLTNFINRNNQSILDNWNDIYSEREIRSIVYELCFNKLKEMQLTEILNIFKEKIKNDSIPSNSDIFDFYYLVLQNNQILNKILQDDNITNLQTLSNILSNKYVKEYITEILVKDRFCNYFYYVKINLNRWNFLEYNISNKYNNRMEYLIKRNNDIFLKLLNMKGILYIGGLKETLEYYYNELSKNAKLEYEKYKYAYKYIFDDKNAIVPADFWENKIIKNLI